MMQGLFKLDLEREICFSLFPEKADLFFVQHTSKWKLHECAHILKKVLPVQIALCKWIRASNLLNLKGQYNSNNTTPQVQVVLPQLFNFIQDNLLNKLVVGGTWVQMPRWSHDTRCFLIMKITWSYTLVTTYLSEEHLVDTYHHFQVNILASKLK